MASPDLPKDIFELLNSSSEPLTTKQLTQSSYGFTSPKNIEMVGAAIRELVTAGRVFEFPPERSGHGTRFGCVTPTNWVAERILKTVKAARGRVTLRQARDGLRKWESAYFDKALGELVADKKLFYLTVRFKYVLSSPPDPFDHLLPRQVSALREIVARINQHRKNVLTMEDLRAFLNGYTVTDIMPTRASDMPTEDLLREWYQEDLPKRGGLASMPIPWTWIHYDSWCRSHEMTPSIKQFQDLLRRLHQAGKIDFISHSMTQNLPERESELSLRGHHGEVLYYWKWR
jgi:hypothetical protein